VTLRIKTLCHFAEFRVLFIVMLNVIMLRVVGLNLLKSPQPYRMFNNDLPGHSDHNNDWLQNDRSFVEIVNLEQNVGDDRQNRENGDRRIKQCDFFHFSSILQRFFLIFINLRRHSEKRSESS
jgi:hypothetical protein